MFVIGYYITFTKIGVATIVFAFDVPACAHLQILAVAMRETSLPENKWSVQGGPLQWWNGVSTECRSKKCRHPLMVDEATCGSLAQRKAELASSSSFTSSEATHCLKEDCC